MRLGIPQILENKGKLRQLVDKQEFIPVCRSYLCPVIAFVLSENRKNFLPTTMQSITSFPFA